MNLPFITEKQTVWDILQAAERPLYLYGMGNGADRILDKCEALGIPIAGVFASDEFVRGQSFRGYPVCTYAQTCAQCSNFIVVIAFATQEQSVLQIFRTLEQRHEVYAPHVAIFADDAVVDWVWLEEHEKELAATYALLADEQSRRVFAAVLNYKLSGKLKYLWQSESQRADDLRELFTFSDKESYVDLGAYDGDTIREFLTLTKGRYQEIFAFEPDSKNFRKLCRFVEAEQLGRVHLLHEGVWSCQGQQTFRQCGGRMSAVIPNEPFCISVSSVDEVLGESKASYIKMDVEGVEYEALWGARNHLRRDHPKLFIAAYHHDDDLWRLPLLIKETGEYEVFLRRHPYVPAWEINYLCR